MNRFISGDKVSKFVIEKLLGQGGFAEAYLATDTRLDRLVVIKCLRPDLGERLEGIKFALEEFQARFLVEARAQARVNHPNVCTLFEVEEENKILILEYIKGVTLEELCAAGPLSKTDLIGIVIAIGNAMVEAHAKDVLHRDLTLRNVMLAEGKQVKLLDFGLAKLIDQPAFTQLQLPIGNPPYMSPEQQRLKDVDARSDIFTFGVLIYRMVTGHFPYLRRFADEPDPERPAPFECYGVDPWPDLNLLTLTALQLRPEDRFQSMKEMLGELLKIRDSLQLIDRALHFFDTSTLVEVFCSAIPSRLGRERKKRAQRQFVVQQSLQSAVTSAGVMAELLEQVLKLYFEAKPGVLGNGNVQNVVADAKERVRERCARNGRGGALAWDRLDSHEKLLFLASVKGLFRKKLEDMASQLAVVDADNHVLLTRWFEATVDLNLPERDARILAEAFSLRASWMFSEERRYSSKPYRRLVTFVGQNLYRLGGHATGGDPLLTPPTPGPAPASLSGAKVRTSSITDTLDLEPKDLS